MSNENKNFDPKQYEPTLGDILQLEATIEALPEVGLRDLSETERIAINRYPEGEPHSEGTVISHITLSQREGTTGRYAAAMNYMVLRDGEEAATRLIKRPPFEIGKNVDPTDMQAVEREVGRASMALADYNAAQQMGIYDLTADEVHKLTQTIEQTYLPKV